MIQTTDFESLEDFIDHLKTKPEIIGILQYGSRNYKDMSVGGDFDLNIIVNSKVDTPIVGLHFHINKIPVDCGVIKADDLLEEIAPSDYHCVLISSKILYDPNDFLKARLPIIKKNWKLNIEHMSEGDIAFERFIRQHIVDKFLHREYHNELYTKVFLSGSIFWLLDLFIKIEQLNPYDFKGALSRMEKDYPKMYALFDAFESTQDLKEKMAIINKLNHTVLNKIGGPWKSDEILFHYADSNDTYSEEEKKSIIDLIF